LRGGQITGHSVSGGAVKAHRARIYAKVAVANPAEPATLASRERAED
jgi:DNA-binding CsgD family transcriptional regulator